MAIIKGDARSLDYGPIVVSERPAFWTLNPKPLLGSEKFRDFQTHRDPQLALARRRCENTLSPKAVSP